MLHEAALPPASTVISSWDTRDKSGVIRQIHQTFVRVLICGAGIAGLTLAWCLERRGHDPVIVERAAHLRDEGYMLRSPRLQTPNGAWRSR